MTTADDPLTEAQVRVAVIARLLEEHRGASATALVVEELGVGRGASRADVAVIAADGLVGVEIKSAADSMARLPAQVRWYGTVFDRAVLVVDPAHLDVVRDLLPSWWGLWTVDRAGLRVLRAGTSNPAQDMRTLARLLWMPELKVAVRAIGQTGGTAGLLRGDLADLLATAAPDHVAGLVRDALLARDWEDVAPPDGGARRVRLPTPTAAVARRARRDNRRARTGRRP